MGELIESLDLALSALEQDNSTHTRLTATSSLLDTLESLLDSPEEDIATHYSKWKTTTQLSLKGKNSALNKFGKALSPLDDWSLSDAYLYPLTKDDTSKTIIDNLIKLHLIRNGNIDIFSTDVDFHLLSQFGVMNSIEKDILQGDLSSAINWCKQNLSPQSDLLFQLHQLKFRQLLLQQDTVSAFHYAKETFPQFTTPATLPAISKLMSSLLFPPAINPTTTNELSPSIDTHQLAQLFAQSFSNRLGFSPTSTLDTLLLAANVALPTVIKYTTLQREKNLNWSTTDELPFEIKLPSFLKHHAVFICPVSKEETGLPGNEAYGLPCGHIVSKISLERLSGKTGGSSSRFYGSTGRLKCPYCPTIFGLDMCHEVRFYRL